MSAVESVYGTRITLADAIDEALQMEMQRDPTVVVFCGLGNATPPQLLTRFGPSRVVAADAVGSALVAMAAGTASYGVRPVCRLGAADGGLPALDQIVEVAARGCAGDDSIPLTFLVDHGDALVAGPDDDPAGRLVGAPGLTVAAPGTAADAKGLVTAAVRDEDPVCVLAHLGLAMEVDAVPEGEYVVDLSRARLAAAGERATVVTYGPAAPPAECAIAEADLDVDLIDLRTLWPIDRDAVVTSVRKTGKLLVVEPSTWDGQVTRDVIASTCEEAFEYLDAPPARLPLAIDDPDGADAIRVHCDDLIRY